MTWANLKATGSGTIRLRLMIEGWPEVFVSDKSITYATNKDGRTVLSGLSYEGVTLNDRILPFEGKCQGTGITFRISPVYGSLDTSGGDDPITAALSTYPSDPVQALTADWAHDNTTWPGSSLTNGNTYHIGTEAFRYNSGGAETRAVWGTQAQSHYATARVGETNTVWVWDRPVTMEGRRAFLYVYGESDNVAGDGTCVWRGIVSRQPRLHSDGVTWLIECQPITAVLSQKVGGGMSEAGVVGLYFNWQSCFHMRMNCNGTEAEFKITGLFTEETFIQEFNSKAGTAIVNAGGNSDIDSIGLYKRPDTGTWQIVIEKSTATAYVFTLSGGSYITGWVDHTEGSMWRLGNETWPAGVLDDAQQYSCHLSWHERYWGDRWTPGSGGRTVSRPPYNYADTPGTVNPLGAAAMVMNTDNHRFVDLDNTSYRCNRLYVDRDLSAVDMVVIQDDALKHSAWAGRTYGAYQIHSTGTTTITTPQGSLTFDYINLGDPADSATEAENKLLNSGAFGFIGPATQATKIIPVSVTTTEGSVADFAQSVADQSVEANKGVAPFVTSSDLSLPWYLYGPALSPDVFARQYAFAKALTLEEVLAADLKFAAHVMRLESTGKIGIIPLPVPSSGLGDYTLDHSVICTPPWPTAEPQRDGTVSAVSVQQEYDAVEDDWKDPPITVQNVDAISTHKNRGRGKIEIRTYSTPTLPPTLESVAGAASQFLALASRDYIVVTVQVPFTMFDVLCGTMVKLTHRLVPNGRGGRGVEDRVCVVVERKWPLDPKASASGTLVLWMPATDIAGYVPSAYVTGKTNTAGNTWTVDMDSASAYNVLLSKDLTGDVAADFIVGDTVQAHNINDSTPTVVTGTVTAKTTDQLTVAFDGVWTPGADTWVLFLYDPDTSHEEQFAWAADSGLVLPFGGTARRFI